MGHGSAGNSAGALDRNAQLRQLHARIAAWPKPVRQVFTLRKVYEFSPPEIVRALGLSDLEVETHLIAAARACANPEFEPTCGDSTAPAAKP